MSIEFKCDFCGKPLKTDDSKAGRQVKCPGCEAVITIPQPVVQTAGSHDYSSSTTQDYSDNNPFAAPQSLQPDSRRASKTNSPITMADRAWRFVGAFVDNLLIYLCIMPGFFIMIIGMNGQNGNEDDIANPMALVGLFLLIAGCALALGLNAYLYATRSQSMAKWLLNMKVLDFETNQPAGLVKGFILRGCLSTLISCIPGLGGLFSLVDCLYILGEEQRCLHDKIAGTYVVNAK